MSCVHERLRTVGDRVFCCACGEELPLEFLAAKGKPKKAENRANNAPEEQKQTKAQGRKRTAKKAE